MEHLDGPRDAVRRRIVLRAATRLNVWAVIPSPGVTQRQPLCSRNHMAGAASSFQRRDMTHLNAETERTYAHSDWGAPDLQRTGAYFATRWSWRGTPTGALSAGGDNAGSVVARRRSAAGRRSTSAEPRADDGGEPRSPRIAQRPIPSRGDCARLARGRPTAGLDAPCDAAQSPRARPCRRQREVLGSRDWRGFFEGRHFAIRRRWELSARWYLFSARRLVERSAGHCRGQWRGQRRIQRGHSAALTRSAAPFKPSLAGSVRLGCPYHSSQTRI